MSSTHTHTHSHTHTHTHAHTHTHVCIDLISLPPFHPLVEPYNMRVHDFMTWWSCGTSAFAELQQQRCFCLRGEFICTSKSTRWHFTHFSLSVLSFLTQYSPFGHHQLELSVWISYVCWKQNHSSFSLSPAARVPRFDPTTVRHTPN